MKKLKKKMIQYLLKNRTIYNLNKEKPFIYFFFFQNPMNFNITTFYLENINPNHKFIVYARKKGFHDYGLIKIAIIKR